jgi:4-diphosphocytidyl-2-C-methyl-D-erythritol kinase
VTSSVVLVRAPAKINLALRVLRRRNDGYHELWAVFQTLALHDTLACAACEGPFRIECETPGVPIDTRNLVWRAADALWRAAGRGGSVPGTVVRIRKRIPAQGGLGGGSSDAAAALVALRHLWRVDLPRESLRPLAAAIGADVPFFLSGGTALGTGRGDEIRPLPDMPHYWVVLLLPPFGVSTKKAFEWWDGRRQPQDRAAGGAGSTESPEWHARAPVVNDLEAAVAGHHPELTHMTAALRDAGATAAAMTGSGSPVFGLFDDRPQAHAAALALRTPGRHTVLTRLVDAAACARLCRPLTRQIRAPHRP